MKEQQLATPVAFIIFNRPETTARVFAEIAKARPAKLLLIADGPRADHPEDAAKCAATRAVVQRVDWPCEVLTNFSETNLGCKTRPVTGLNWVFENVPEAIILEDDCLPHPTFFRFCEELLERYRDDERVMMVSGLNLLGEWRSELQSYHFSFWGGTWGWATWRRAWNFFDPEIADWPLVLKSGLLDIVFDDSKTRQHWETILQKVHDKTIDSAWDYQWLLACWLQSGYRVIPEVNLISNVGFGKDATHHTRNDDPLANLATTAMDFPLRHPPFMIKTRSLDETLVLQHYSPKSESGFISGLGRVARKVKKLSSSNAGEN